MTDVADLSLNEMLEQIEGETPTSDVDLGELYMLCAQDQELYARTFFPKTFRQVSPAFHADYWRKIEDPSFDLFGAEVFRGGAKTTLARVAISRRIAYAISRNILNVCISESMALLTSRWLKKQVENNTLWSQTYCLKPGEKWTDEFFEVKHELEGITIAVTAKGMTSGLRGLNLDDWRPDFIYCDDIANEENTGSEDSLNKLNDLVFGALVPSLAPKSEAPLRKFVLTNTAIKKDDPINRAHKDPAFQTVKYPKLVVNPETGEEESAWPARWTTEEVLKEKDEYTRRRQLHVWLREFGCKITGAGECAFLTSWLRDWQVLPSGMTTYIGIDPASQSKQKRAHKSAIVVIGLYGGEIYLLDYFAQKGKNPEEIWHILSGYVRKWRPRMVGVESVAYQKVLKWYLEEKMKLERFYFPIQEVNDRRPKPDRIRQAFSGMAALGKFFVREDQLEWRSEWEQYTDDMDIDLLDAGAMAVCLAMPWMLEGQGGTVIDEDGKVVDQVEYEERSIAPLSYVLGAP